MCFSGDSWLNNTPLLQFLDWGRGPFNRPLKAPNGSLFDLLSRRAAPLALFGSTFQEKLSLTAVRSPDFQVHPPKHFNPKHLWQKKH